MTNKKAQLKRVYITGIKGIWIIAIICSAIFLTGCKKLVTVSPPNSQLISSTIFQDSITAQAATSGMYTQLYNAGTGSSFYSYNVTLDPSRSADEMYAVQNSLDQFGNNTLTPANTDVTQLWNNSYNIIYNANSIISGVQASTALSATLKKQLTGEAKFVRAFCYFYLANYFGDVPLAVTPDIAVNASLGRTPINDVYAQIITDLTDARTALALNYSWSQGNRTRVNTWAASALLARVYLYQNRWAEAEAEATRVIGQTSLYNIIADPNNVFLKNSNETILSFYSNVYGYTYTAAQTVLTGLATPNYAMRNELIQAFETGDTRFNKWTSTVTVLGTSYRFPYKYKSITNAGLEYEIALRLSEQYLIRSEARMQQTNITGSQSDLNVIRNRAGLANTTATDQASLKTAIEHERQTELFYEWGHRWLDLKRTGRSDVVLGTEKPTGWQSTDILYPIPATAISTNTKLVQNPGYN